MKGRADPHGIAHSRHSDIGGRAHPELSVQRSAIMAHLFSAIADRIAGPTPDDIRKCFGYCFCRCLETTPYMALLLLAGLQTIPEELYESSSLEGANGGSSSHITRRF